MNSIRPARALVITAIVAAIAATFLLSGCAPPNSGPLQIGGPVPDFAVRDENDNEVRLSDFRGNIVFVNIWATWCPPCRDEMPAMQVLHDAFADRPFKMMAVSIDSGFAWEPIQAFYQEYDIDLPTYVDPGRRVAQAFGARGVPETFIIDADGNLLERYIGEQSWTRPDLISQFDTWIKELETMQSSLH